MPGQIELQRVRCRAGLPDHLRRGRERFAEQLGDHFIVSGAEDHLLRRMADRIVQRGYVHPYNFGELRASGALFYQGGKVRGVFESDTNPVVSSANCPKTYPKPDPSTGTTYVYGDCHGVIFIPRADIVAWTFSWTAPAAGSGPLTVFYGVVDGDHHGKSSLDDDVKMGTVKLTEGS